MTETTFDDGTGQLPGIALVDLDSLDIAELWQDSAVGHEAFLTALRVMVTNPDAVDSIGFCEGCDEPNDTNSMTWIEGSPGPTVCEDCLYNYSYCESCDKWRSERDAQWLGGANASVCEDCIGNYYTYCDGCQEYYPAGGGDHNHPDRRDCHCASPAQAFSIRNEGDEPLSNDKRVTVSLPSGVISDVGIGTIANLLRQHAYGLAYDDRAYGGWSHLANRLSEIDARWQAKEGNYTKRLSRFAYEEYGLKVTPDVLSKVGTIAREHSTGVDFHVEVTRRLNLPASDFGDGASCFWLFYYESRCTLKSNGAFGLRTFAQGGHGVTGRAWVMPLKLEDGDLTPTFDAKAADAFIVFNGYGELSAYAPARIMSHMAGMTYRKVSLTAAPIHINSGAGYLVAPEEIAKDYTGGSLTMDLDSHSNLYTSERTMQYA